MKDWTSQLPDRTRKERKDEKIDKNMPPPRDNKDHWKPAVAGFRELVEADRNWNRD